VTWVNLFGIDAKIDRLGMLEMAEALLLKRFLGEFAEINAGSPIGVEAGVEAKGEARARVSAG